jgi:hypothetical protein
LFAAIVRDIAAAAYWGNSQWLMFNLLNEKSLSKGAVEDHPAWKWLREREERERMKSST